MEAHEEPLPAVEPTTQYIYTKEGELIPTSSEVNIDISKHPDPQNICIEQVDFQYEAIEAVGGETHFVSTETTVKKIETSTTVETVDAKTTVETSVETVEEKSTVETVEGEPEQEILETLKDNPIIEIQQDETAEAVEPEPEVPKEVESKEEAPQEPKKSDEPVEEPAAEPVVNGKSPAKQTQRPEARMGVRMPPKTLTSRIVSRTEIEKEIIERARKKEQAIISKVKGVNKTEGKKKDSGESKVKKAECSYPTDSNANEEKSNGKADAKPKAIEDNSDLLAILEGHDIAEDIAAPPEKPNNPPESTPEDMKNLEREIALQQLHDLPYLEPKTKIVKPLKFKDSEKPKKIHIMSTSPPKTDPERPLKVLKTYSRKRKSTENSSAGEPPITPTKKIKEKPVQSADGRIYVTKSSRVIKKKVIWDPDDESPQIKPKPVQPKSQDKSADVKKSAADADVKKTAEKSERKESAKPPKEEKIVKVKEEPVQDKKAKEKKKSPLKKSPVEKKKSRTEVDRLLGDEGAIKMLYELKADKKGESEPRRAVIRVDRTLKELAKKANQIKSDLVNTSSAETPKNLRKKDSPLKASFGTPVPAGIKRQISKDSTRSTTPPRSPGGSFFNNEAYLIRRRSSSSIDSDDDDLDTTGGSMEYEDSEEAAFSKKLPITPSEDPLKTKPAKLDKSPKKPGQYKTFTLKKTNKSVTIELGSPYMTSELLNELTTALDKASDEPDCSVVLVKSSDSQVFSHGLDYKEMVSDKEAVRRQKATKMAESVRNFMECLASFKKVLIAGVQGQCAGLATTMLPLFDVVISSDDAKFSASYARLGCVPEAGFLLEPPFVYGLFGRLVLANETLTADEVYRKGLVATLCWPEKYQDTLRTTLASASEGSPKAIEAIKAEHMKEKINRISEELEGRVISKLVGQWTSNKCQQNFKKLN